MSIIKKFDMFIGENTAVLDKPAVKPRKIDDKSTDSNKSAQSVIYRLCNVYQDSSKEEKKEIDSYFEK